MKRFSALLGAVLCAAALLPVPVLAQNKPALLQTSTAAAQYPMPQPPEIAAKAYLLIDVTSGQVLAEKNASNAVEPASLTKLMTAYLTFDALKNKKLNLQQTLTISPRARAMEGSRMFVDVGQQVPVEDLIKGMIVQSGNDATVALAEGVGGTVEHFVVLMNAQAKLLGMNHTHYHNPEGLTVAGHTTTAHDLAVLAQRLMQDFPEYVHYYAIKKYHYPGTPPANDSNRNLLLFRDPSVDGLKTGHTEAAGYCLVATARREYPGVGQRRLLSVVLGTSSENARAAESQKLLNWGYSAYQPVKLFEANQAIATPQVWKGAANTVRLGLPRPVVVAVPTGSAMRVSTQVARPEPILAPLAQGQQLGMLNVSIAGQRYAQIPLQALQAVPQAGWFGRAWDAVRLWIQ